MADYQGSIPFREFDSAVSSGRREFIVEDYVQDMAEAILFEESPLIARFVDAGDFDTLAPEWETKQDWPRQLWAQVTDSGGGAMVITFSAQDWTTGTALDAAHLAQIVHPRTPLIKMVNGIPEQVQIKSTETVNTLNTLDVESTIGGTVTADAAPVLYRIGPTPRSPKDPLGLNPVALERQKEHTYAQLFWVPIEMNVIDKALKERTVKNPWQEKIDDALRLYARDKAQAFITQEPVYSGGLPITLYSEAHAKMAGLWWWIQKVQADQANPNIYVNAAGAQPDPMVIQSILHHLQVDEHARFPNCGYEIWGNQDIMRYPHLWEREFIRTGKSDHGIGFYKTNIGVRNGVEGAYKDGMVSFFADEQIPPGMMFILPTKRIKHGHLKGCRFQRWEEDRPNFLGQQATFWEVVVGLAPVNPREIGCYFNLAAYE